MLSEDDTSELNQELQDKLLKIKTKDDLKKFMQDNADEIKASYSKANKKSKPFYKKAWDWLCTAVGSTANFVANNMGTVLVAAGVLYAGHAIGWKNIKAFFTGKDDAEDKKFDTIVDKATTDTGKAMSAAIVAKTELSPEQQQRVFAIRRRLPKAVPLDKCIGVKDLFVSIFNPSKANRMSAEMHRNSQNGSST